MILQCKLAVCILDLFLACVLLNAENLIIIPFATQCRSSSSLSYFRQVSSKYCYGEGFGPAALPVGSAALPVGSAALPVGSAALPVGPPLPPKSDPAAPACADEAPALWYACVLISPKTFFNSCILALMFSVLLLEMASRISCVALFTFST